MCKAEGDGGFSRFTVPIIITAVGGRLRMGTCLTNLACDSSLSFFGAYKIHALNLINPLKLSQILTLI